MMLPPTENSAAPVAAADGAISSAFFSCSLNAATRWTDAPVTYLTKITLSDMQCDPEIPGVKSPNPTLRITGAPAAAPCLLSPREGGGCISGLWGHRRHPAPSVHFTHMAMAAAPVKESDAGEGESHKTRETVDGRRTDANPQSTPHFYGSFPCGVRPRERESDVSFWIELHFAVPSILRSRDAAADPISIVGLEAAAFPVCVVK